MPDVAGHDGQPVLECRGCDQQVGRWRATWREGVAGAPSSPAPDRLMGLEAIYRKPRTSDAQPDHHVYPYLRAN